MTNRQTFDFVLTCDVISDLEVSNIGFLTANFQDTDIEHRLSFINRFSSSREVGEISPRQSCYGIVSMSGAGKVSWWPKVNVDIKRCVLGSWTRNIRIALYLVSDMLY